MQDQCRGEERSHQLLVELEHPLGVVPKKVWPGQGEYLAARS